MSLIEDFTLIQGDSSEVFFFGLPDGSVLDVNWNAVYTIQTKYGETPIISRTLPKNTGGEITVYPENTRFVFQILKDESSILTIGQKYEVAVQITNDTLDFNREVAQFKIKVAPQGVI